MFDLIGEALTAGTAVMRVRFHTILFAALLLATFALGAFLLLVADETPAPGLILIGIWVVALVFYFRGDRRRPPGDEPFGPSPIERDRETYEQEQERKRREPRIW